MVKKEDQPPQKARGGPGSTGPDAPTEFGSADTETVGVEKGRKATPHEETVGRYHIEKLLGAGGMGVVYQAYDPKLDRHVALKLLQVTSRKNIRRFFHEARAQARVDHPHVCKVYEVGEADAKPYISMQYIDGLPFNRAARSMTTEAIVRTIADATRGVQAAHELGLIHRDIKPGNILIRRTDEGAWWSYVTDFGLAREEEGPGMTATGIIVGTPHYMSPEQARGESRINRTADVYSLGATLYTLLADRPPFDGATGIDVIMKVIEEDPPPLRSRVSSTPRDLETIVMKCLEKEPDRRYPSAKALADDLERYLAGDPIEARKAAWSYRLIRKARKHPWVTALLLLLIFSSLGFSIGLLKTLRAAKTRARLATRFEGLAKSSEALLRYAYMMKPHDLTADKNRAQANIRVIRRIIREQGRLAEAPGWYAIGRLHMAMRNNVTAQADLEKALRADPGNPEIAYALSLALVEVYQSERERVRGLTDPRFRKAEKRRIEQQYRLRAIHLLQQGHNAQGVSNEWVKAELAFLDQDYNKAIERAQKTLEQTPWLYEASILIGDSYHDQAVSILNAGKYEAGLGYVRKALDAYQAARETGRSDPLVFSRLCLVQANRAFVFLNSAKPASSAIETARSICRKGLDIDPTGEAFYRLSAGLDNVSALWTSYNGGDPRPILQRGLQTARKGLTYHPDSIELHTVVGQLLMTSVEHSLYCCGIPDRDFDKATREFIFIRQKQPTNVTPYESLGILDWYRAYAEWFKGGDPEPYTMACFKDTSATLHVDPGNVQATYTRGMCAWTLARYRIEQGRDPEELLNMAIASLEKRRSDTTPFNNLGLGYTYASKAAWDKTQRRDYTTDLEKAKEFFKKTLAVNPNIPFTYEGLAWVKAIPILKPPHRAPWKSQAFTAALRDLDKAVSVDPRFLESRFLQADLYLARAERDLEWNRSPASVLTKAGKVIDAALKWNPKSARALARKGRWFLLKARSMTRIGKSPVPLLTASESAYKTALAATSDLPWIHRGFAELQWYVLVDRLAKHRPDAAGAFVQGVTHLIKATEKNPHDAEAMVLQAAFAAVSKHIHGLQPTLGEPEKFLQQACESWPMARSAYRKRIQEAERILGSRGSLETPHARSSSNLAPKVQDESS